MEITRGSEEIQRQIIEQARISLKLLGAESASFMRFDAEMKPSRPALNLLSDEMQRLGADRELLATIGSWGDTLQPEDVLELLKEWNQAEEEQRR